MLVSIFTSKQGKILLLIGIKQTIVVVTVTITITIRKTVMMTMMRVIIYNKIS